jgi:hypothetical protein
MNKTRSMLDQLLVQRQPYLFTLELTINLEAENNKRFLFLIFRLHHHSMIPVFHDSRICSFSS